MLARGLGLAAAAAALMTAASASCAADLVLDCKVEANRPDHGHDAWRRQIVIDPGSRHVRILDDFGHGLQPRAEYPLVSMDERRIVLEANVGKVSEINRATGEYMLRDARARFALRGHCTRK